MNARRVLRWGLGIGVLAALLALAFGGWLLRSDGGRDWLLARVVASLPAGSSLQWRRIEGRATGPLAIDGLDYRQADGLRVQAARIRLDHSVWPLLARRWQIRTLEAEGVTVRLPRDDTPFEWPRWPEVLSTLNLPLAVAVADLRVRGLAVTREDAPLLQLDTLRTALRLGPGELGLAGLEARGPRLHVRGTVSYLPREDYRTAINARVDGGGKALHLIARGDLGNFAASLEGRLPGASTANLRLRDGRDTPQWQLEARSEALDPTLFGLADTARWRGDLRMQGRGGDATLGGRVERNDLALVLDGSRLQANAAGLTLAPLVVGLPQGTLRTTGRVDFSARPAALQLRVATEGLRLAATQAGAEDVRVTGAVEAKGTLDRWTLAGDLGLRRAREQATLALRGVGSTQALRLDTLQARMPSGRLDGTARLQWSPTLAVATDLRLAGFDPGYLAPDFPGVVDGELRLQAERDARDRWSGTLEAPALGGRLRDRPLQARARAEWRDDRGEGELALALGGSRLEARGRFGAQLDLQADARPLELADLWPDARGRVQGRVALRGPRAAPEIEADLGIRDLQWRDYAARELQVRGRLPQAPAQGRFTATGRGLRIAGQAADHLDLALQGNRRAFTLQGGLDSPSGRLRVTGDARQAGATGEAVAWQGRLQALQLAPARGPGWRLQAPTTWAYGAAGLRFERACLGEDAGPGQACAQLGADAATVSGRQLAIALVEPWLGEAARDYESVGLLGFDGRLTRRADAWSSELTVTSAEGGVRLRAAPDTPLLAYRDLRLQLALRDGRLQAEGGAALSGGGRLALRGAGGLEDDAPIDGTLELDVRDLAWMELLSPDLAAPTGRLEGRIVVAGTRAAPTLGGEARLRELGAELPALGVPLRDGDVRLSGEPGGALRIEGSLRAGEGRLTLAGGLDLREARQPLVLSVTGENVRISDTAELQATVSPRLQLRYLDGELQVRGVVAVPSARLDLERLDQGVTPSADVVVLDPRPGRREGGIVFDTEVTVQVGEDVRLQGFGLTGRLSGELAIRDRPGRAATANGSLQVNGRYRAYGRDLRIRRARLSWVNAPYADPALDVLAEHEFDEATVGVRVRGSAQAPQTSVTSDPAMSTAEAISWLLLGRPLETASGSEAQRVSASVVALSAGSSLLAQQLGTQLGLDSAGIVENRSLGGSTLVVGKRLSPKLFVSYGVSLLGTGQAVMLKYLLKRGLSLGLESGTVETAASLDWRKEK